LLVGSLSKIYFY